jgi:hypothetical protein
MTTQQKGKGKLASAFDGSYGKRMEESNQSSFFYAEY